MASKPYAVVMAMRIKDQATRGVNRVTQSVTKLRQRMAFRARDLGWHRVTAQVRRLRTQLGGAAGAVRQFVTRWMTLGAAAAAGGLLAMISRVTSIGDATSKMAQRIGLGVEKMQELQYAGERYGASTEDVNNSIRSLAKNIGEAANGTGEAGPMFKALGIELHDANGKIKATDVVLGEIADKLAMIPDAAARVAISQKLMEEGGVRLVPLLVKGSDELARMAIEAQRLGVIKADTAKKMEAFSDRLTNVRQAALGIGSAITAKLLPYLSPMIKAFGDWAAVNREFIASRVGSVVERVANAVRSVDWSGVGSRVARFTERVGQSIDFLGGWTQSFMILGGVMASHLIAPIVRASWALGVLGVQMAAATMRTAAFIAVQQVQAVMSFFASLRFGVGIVHSLNFALRANPIGVIITAIQVVAGLGAVLYNSFKPFQDLIDGIWSRISKLISGAGQWMAKKFGINIDAFKPSAPSIPTRQADTPGAAPAASRLGPAPSGGQAQMGAAAIRVTFENAPPGMRVAQGSSSGGVQLETQVNAGPSLVALF